MLSRIERRPLPPRSEPPTNTLKGLDMNRQTAFFLATCLVLTALFAAPVTFGDDSVNHSAGMTLAGAPLAIHGYDPVAFFTDGTARIGDARYTVAHGDAAYRFVSEANQRKFDDNPEAFLPQYGGFCAYGVALGAKFDGDPRMFAIVNGKLYFNLDPAIQGTWKEDLASNIQKADGNWPKIRAAAPASLK